MPHSKEQSHSQAQAYVHGYPKNIVLNNGTTLSDADRRALMLWDDFLVYAVALGQNQQGVDELVQIWKHPQPLE